MPLPSLTIPARVAARAATCANGHDHSWWRPSGPDRKKGYCQLCKDAVEAAYRARMRTAA